MKKTCASGEPFPESGKPAIILFRKTLDDAQGHKRSQSHKKKKRQKEDGARKCHPALLTKKNSNPCETAVEVELSGRHGYSYILCQTNAAFQKRNIIPTVTYTGGGVIALWRRKGYFLILICCT